MDILQSIENIYAINSKRQDKNGYEYMYPNYRTYIPYDFIKIMGIGDKLWMYWHNGKTYITSSVPNGYVPARRLSVYTQKGTTDNPNTWKRLYTVPKKFYPGVNETMKTKYTLYLNRKDEFSDSPYTLMVELIEE